VRGDPLLMFIIDGNERHEWKDLFLFLFLFSTMMTMVSELVDMSRV
jgi:hypothetical protein